jgi:hypothetical protein
MRKLTDQERQLLQLISSAGGSACPGTDTVIPKAGHKALRHLVSRGDLTVEETDDGPKFSLTAQGQSEADHG